MIRMYRTPFASSSWEKSAYAGKKRTAVAIPFRGCQAEQ
jgi:hypothetical protein